MTALETEARERIAFLRECLPLTHTNPRVYTVLSEELRELEATTPPAGGWLTLAEFRDVEDTLQQVVALARQEVIQGVTSGLELLGIEADCAAMLAQARRNMRPFRPRKRERPDGVSDDAGRYPTARRYRAGCGHTLAETCPGHGRTA